MKKFSKENKETPKDGVSAVRKSRATGNDARATGSKAPNNTKAEPKVEKPPKRGVGRPSSYRPEYCDLLISFFRIDIEKEVEVVKQDKDGKPVTVTETVVNRFPTLERFADTIGVSAQTLRNWTEAHADFDFAYRRSRDLQVALLVEGGMGGHYESRFAALAAKNLIGWRDQVEQTVTATVTQATVDELDRLYQQGMAATKAGRNAVAMRRQARERSD